MTNTLKTHHTNHRPASIHLHPDALAPRAALDMAWQFASAVITLAYTDFLDAYPAGPLPDVESSGTHDPDIRCSFPGSQAAPASSRSRRSQLIRLPQSVGSTTLFPTLNGNANLKPETADTYTAGVVLSSPFETPFLKRLRLTVDYYNIRVNDAIGAQSVDIAQRQCFDTAFNPTLSADSAFCNGVINRNTNGGLGNVITTFLNSGRFRTSGIDFQLDWTVPVGPGQLNVNSVMNYLLYTKSAELPVLPLVDYTGTLGTT
jgi:iron complex outermembrane receptor protein